jgi:hypothetical protein
VRTEVVTGNATMLAMSYERFVTTGTDIEWRLRYEPDTTQILPTVQINGAYYGTNLNGLGSSSALLNIVTLAPGVIALSIGNAPIPAAGSIIEIFYAYAAPILVEGVNHTAQNSAGRLPSWGRMGYAAQNGGATLNQSLATARNNVALWATPYGQVDMTLSEETDTRQLELGQALHFIHNRLGFTFDGAITAMGIIGSQAGGGGVHQTRVSMRGAL